MPAPNTHVRIIARAARMLSALEANGKHARRDEYKTGLAGAKRDWAALSASDRKSAIVEARTIHDLTDKATIAKAVAHLEG